MGTERENLLRMRLRYGMYALVVISGLLIGGWLMPPEFMVAFKVLFGGLMTGSA